MVDVSDGSPLWHPLIKRLQSVWVGHGRLTGLGRPPLHDDTHSHCTYTDDSVSVSMHTYNYIYTYTYIHTFTHTYRYYAHMYCTYWLLTCTRTHTHKHTHTHTQTDKCAHILTSMQPYTQTHSQHMPVVASKACNPIASYPSMLCKLTAIGWTCVRVEVVR